MLLPRTALALALLCAAGAPLARAWAPPPPALRRYPPAARVRLCVAAQGGPGCPAPGEGPRGEGPGPALPRRDAAAQAAKLAAAGAVALGLQPAGLASAAEGRKKRDVKPVCAVPTVPGSRPAARGRVEPPLRRRELTCSAHTRRWW